VAVAPAADAANRQPGQSPYRQAYRAFRALLGRWGAVCEVNYPESQLDFVIAQTQQRGESPISLAMVPFGALYPTRLAPNAAYFIWDYPEIPHEYLCYSPRPDWVAMANKLALILVDNRFTAEALDRSGITTPVEIVPVPVPDLYFSVPAWSRERVTRLDCTSYLFPQVGCSGSDPWNPGPADAASNLHHRLVSAYRKFLKPFLPNAMHRRLLHWGVRDQSRSPSSVVNYLPCEQSGHLDLSQIVYTAMINPADSRDNWRDIVSAFVYAFAERPDVTLVLVLNMPAARRAELLNRIHGFYLRQVRGLCSKLALVLGPLNSKQKERLVLGTTFFVTAARAKGIYPALGQFLAAGRPALAPCHSGLADSFGPDAGLVVASHPECARIPGDPERRLVTTRHRIVWQSLVEHFRQSYAWAKENSADYHILSACARRRTRARAGMDAVWPRLQAALDGLMQSAETRRSLAFPSDCKAAG
jgi:hypothetical protein